MSDIAEYMQSKSLNNKFVLFTTLQYRHTCLDAGVSFITAQCTGPKYNCEAPGRGRGGGRGEGPMRPRVRGL